MQKENLSLVIEAGQPEKRYWSDLWRYRELLYFLAWRDILVRYKQTVIGVFWALLPAIATAGIFSIVFGRFAHLPSGNIPYPLLVLTGTLPWTLFSNVLSQTGGSLLSNAQLISKIYFPRLLIPLSALLVSVIDFLLSGILLAGVMFWYHACPTWKILSLPIFLGMALAASLGAGLWLAALNVQYRDFRYAIPFLIQLGLYLSPVGFSIQLVPPSFRGVYALNPLVGIIHGFRWALLDRSVALEMQTCLISGAVTLLLLVTGILYFRKMEQRFADVI